MKNKNIINRIEHSESADRGEFGPDPDTGLLPKFNGDFLVQRYVLWQIFMKIRPVFQRYEANHGKMLYLAVLKNPSKIPWCGCRCRWLPSCNQFLLVGRYTSGKIFMKIWSIDFIWSY